MRNLTNLIFLLLENFTSSDRTPPYLDTHLQLIPNFGNSGKKLSDKNYVHDFFLLLKLNSCYRTPPYLDTWYIFPIFPNLATSGKKTLPREWA